MLREIYEQYLINKGYSEVTPSGHNSVVYKYVNAVERIVERENLTWDTLANDIGNIVRKYDRGGSEEEFGRRGNRTYISALRRFQEMLANMPAFTPASKYSNGTAQPYPSLRNGADESRRHVDYADNVSEEERVPGLCSSIEEVYGAVIDFASNVIGRRCDFGELRKIRVILKKECPTRTYRNDSEYIAKKLNEIAQQGRQITAKDVESALYKTTRVLGEFCHRNTDPYIVIYYRQFKADNWCEYIAGIANTLAHEYAHYLEYLYCNRYSTEPFSDSRVSEGMADFFGVLFSINHGGACDLAVAQNEYDEWVEHFGSSWPYAEALRFYTVGGNELSPFSNNYADYETHGSIAKFVFTFRNCPDPVEAYEIMVNE